MHYMRCTGLMSATLQFLATESDISATLGALIAQKGVGLVEFNIPLDIWRSVYTPDDI